MPRKSEAVDFLKNFYRSIAANKKVPVAARIRCADRYGVLCKVLHVKLQEDPREGRPEETPLKEDDLDSSVAEMLKRIKNGGDNGK